MNPKTASSTNENNVQQTQEQSVIPAEAWEYITQLSSVWDGRWLFAIMVIIILEMATPIGILFPTDAIVFGWWMYFSAKGTIPGWIWMIIFLFTLAVILWDLLWFRWGSLLSPKLQTMQDNWIFKKKYITMCEQYFNEYGNKTMLVSKFLPIRSMIPLVAGVIMKPFRPFLGQSMLSAILWVWSLLWISYFIIWLIPEAANHIWLLTFLFVVVPQVVSVWYMILPAMKKYEKKVLQAKSNFQNIVDEVSVIGTQFSAIWHEVKEIFTKVVHDDVVEVTEKSSDPVAVPVDLPVAPVVLPAAPVPVVIPEPSFLESVAVAAVSVPTAVADPSIVSELPMVSPVVSSVPVSVPPSVEPVPVSSLPEIQVVPSSLS